MTHIRRQSWVCVLFAAMWGLVPATGVALDYGSSNLSIQILNKGSGEAVENAAVCLGTRANAEQFGAKRTGADGMVRFDDLLPDSLLVTVSKSGFKGGEQLLEAVSKGRVFVLKIASGGGGPECDAPAARLDQQESAGLSISHIGVDKAVSASGAGQVLVSVSVRGAANQIRIGERADFSGAEWQALQSPVAYQFSDGGAARDLYIQVRRYAQVEGAIIEVVSPVSRVKYRP